ncbi:MAG: alpha-L-fucosidase [Ginsengibacter sp.]
MGKKIISPFLILFFLYVSTFPAYAQAQKKTPEPTPQQYAWHEQGRIMFVALDPATWEGREYDNHSIPLSRINPKKLNTDQWCQAAKLWGAKEILFVAKHTGGFCWWQTHTTSYGIRNTPWKNGKGDVLKELSASCRKYGLNLGIYVYPGDESWGAGIGSGGKTNDPSKQEAYNKIYREQLKEVLTRYGKIKEVWFDGSCVIKVSDIIKKYAKDAVIFQGPLASIRWAGTESGRLSYPAWNTLKSTDLKTGLATEAQGDPDGDAWAPLEADTPLYDHFWFWSPNGEKKIKSLNELMEDYYKSVGYGGVLLLNATPDTTGLIPDADMKLYSSFGNEIARQFGHPIEVEKNKKDSVVAINFNHPVTVNQVVIMEDYRYGQRIREYNVEGWTGSEWKLLSQGTSVGRKKIDRFSPKKVSKVRLSITKSVGTPLIRSFEVMDVKNPDEENNPEKKEEWKKCGSWDEENFKNGSAILKLDLSSYITTPGQYEVKFVPSGSKNGLLINDAELFFENEKAAAGFLTKANENTFNINRTQQVTRESSSKLKVKLDVSNVTDQKGIIYIRSRFEQ